MAKSKLANKPRLEWRAWSAKNLLQSLNQKQNIEPMSAGRGRVAVEGQGAEWLIVMLSRLKRAGQVL